MLSQLLQNKYVSIILDFIFPPLCLGCGEYTEDEHDICWNCRSRFELWEHPFCINCQLILPDKNECPVCLNKTFLLFSSAHYQEPITEIIKQYKFKGITKSSVQFAEYIEQHFKEKILALKPECLVPIPLVKERENIRGYNQAEIFADKLGDLLKLPVNNELLFRNKKRKPQARLKLNARADNIKDVFLTSDEKIHSQRLILVDDVVTSGMTVTEAKKVLSQQQHEVLAVISIAQAF